MKSVGMDVKAAAAVAALLRQCMTDAANALALRALTCSVNAQQLRERVQALPAPGPRR